MLHTGLILGRLKEQQEAQTHHKKKKKLAKWNSASEKQNSENSNKIWRVTNNNLTSTKLANTKN